MSTKPYSIVLAALILTFLGTLVFGQNRISGKITDATTGEPVPFASVFFANTTFGASTDQNGFYRFAGFPAGKYDLTVSFVGYNPYQLSVEFTQNQLEQVDVKLVQQTVLLNEILVKPDTLNWKRNYEDFKRLFLGTSRYASEVTIQNPRDIHLYFDPQLLMLVAHAKKPIIVENSATGYRIHYHLHLFEYNIKEQRYTIYGVPRFEALTPKRKGDEKKWERTRGDLYSGSLLHFMRSWLQQRWNEDGFAVARAYRILNKERPSDEFLNAKISTLRKKMADEGKPLVFRVDANQNSKKVDSLSYYFRLRSLPKEKDSVVNELLTGNEFTDLSKKEVKEFSGILNVTFKEKEDPDYAAQRGRATRIMKQQSLLHIFKPLKLYDNGYYEDVRTVFIEDYWAWSEKIATLLPLNYQPATKK